MKKILLIGLFLCCHLALSAQLTYGTTGLLHAPSAEMQRDKTVMIGGNFLNKEITPPTWDYHTYNYFLNVTIFHMAGNGLYMYVVSVADDRD